VLNGQNSLLYSEKSVGEVIKQLAHKANIKNKRVYPHLIRHCHATHLVESGTDINIIQRILGHSNVKTTAIYTHISHNLISKINTPLSNIILKNKSENETPIYNINGSIHDKVLETA
jgi:site-specific recombinase XerD